MANFTRKALLSFTPISSHLLRARIDSKHGKITVLTCYAPTNEAEDEDKDDFYVVLSSELSSMPPHDYLIVLGDFKAGVANSSGLYDTAIGPVTVDALNDNGEWLLNFCITHAISVTNTWFVRRDITKHTLYRNEGKTRRHWLSSVQNCRSYRGAELGNTDDCLVSSRIKLWLRANKSNSSSSKKIYISQLKQDPSVRERYMAESSEVFDLLSHYYSLQYV
ncbi:hypothetical protein QYM36_011016 [Artemia franciscana]|uniref:Endonuclease/exonuclease/phosphatase domain-containing protein n=1 Tax=Artemia franciscana TaxID=6661 RepID=A0AA88HME5_ARTSF|nr:hypothetical protein QYM36_011016 [Artemia franciscana]